VFLSFLKAFAGGWSRFWTASF